MKILAIYNVSHDRQVTGGHKRFYRLLEHLAGRHEVTLLCTGVSKELEAKLHFVQTARPRILKSVLPQALAFSLSACASLGQICHSPNVPEFKLVYTFGESNGMVCLRASRKLGIPSVLVTRADKSVYYKVSRVSTKRYGWVSTIRKTTEAIKHAVELRLWTYLYKRFSRIIVQSESHRRSIIQALGSRSGVQVDVVPNDLPPDLPNVKRQQDTNGKVRLIYVGSLIPRKGVDTLLEALAILAGDNQRWELQICGDGKYRRSLQDMAERLGLLQNVRFEGYIENVSEQIRESDLLVLPSRADEFPNVLLEAMASGVAAVGTRVGAVPEIIGDDAVVPPGSPAQMANMLRRFLDFGPRDALRQQQQERANWYRFNWESAMESAITGVVSEIKAQYVTGT